MAFISISALLILLHLPLLLLLVGPLEGQPLDNIVCASRKGNCLAAGARSEGLDDVGDFEFVAVGDWSRLHLDFFDVSEVQIQIVHSNDAVSTLNAV